MRLYFAPRLPDQKPDEDVDEGAGASEVRYLAKRKTNYTVRDFRRFSFANGVFAPDPVEEGTGIVGTIRRDKARRVVIEAARTLQGRNIRLAREVHSPAYLPKAIIEHKLADGCTKAELAQAMREAILDGRLVVGTGWSGSRNKVEVLTVADGGDEKKS
jgi:hypothetical protein